jgi:flagellar biosynthesis protein FlhF
MIFTKLDEAHDVGSLLNVASQSGIPLSYLTHGQDVPNDIDVASAQKLAMLLTERPARPTAAA